MKLTSFAFAAALALTAGAASAQPVPPPGAGPRAEGHQWQRPDPAQIAQRRADMAQRHAQHLRDVLQLRPDQEPALQALLSALQPPAGARDHDHDRMDRQPGAAPLSTPERLDRMQARMAEHATRFQQHAAAIKRFYAELTPAQQRAFDAMGPMMMGHGMHGMHGHHGMGERGEMGGFRGGPDHRPPPPSAG